MIELLTAAIIALSTICGTGADANTTSTSSDADKTTTTAPIGTGGWDDNG